MNTKKTLGIFTILALLTNLFVFSIDAKAEPYTPKDPGTIYDDLTGDYGILGIAAQFHIFAREKITINTHTNGNVATRELDANGNFGTDIIDDSMQMEINYIQATDSLIPSSTTSETSKRINKFVVGNQVAVGEEDGHPVVNGSRLDHLTLEEFYQDAPGNTYIDFNAEFAKLIATADRLMSLQATRSYTAADFPDMNNRTIDLSDINSTEPVIINVDASVLALNTPLAIKNPNENVTVINVTNSPADFTVQSPIHYNDRVNHETEDFSDANLSWNFGNSVTTLAINAAFQGTVIAPNADITVTQNLDGTIIGNNVVLNAATNRWDSNEIFITDSTDTTVHGEKIWEDNDDLANKRPLSITVSLLQNGVPYKSQEVAANAAGQWLYTFDNLPKYDQQGIEYSYSVREVNVPADYVSQVVGYNIINTYTASSSSSSSSDTTTSGTSSSETTSTTTDTSSSDTSETTTSDSSDSSDSTTTTSDSSNSSDSTTGSSSSSSSASTTTSSSSSSTSETTTSDSSDSNDTTTTTSDSSNSSDSTTGSSSSSSSASITTSSSSSSTSETTTSDSSDSNDTTTTTSDSSNSFGSMTDAPVSTDTDTASASTDTTRSFHSGNSTDTNQIVPNIESPENNTNNIQETTNQQNKENFPKTNSRTNHWYTLIGLLLLSSLPLAYLKRKIRQ